MKKPASIPNAVCEPVFEEASPHKASKIEIAITLFY
jgi:hypothetical protein